MLRREASLVNREKEKYLLGCPEITRHLIPFIPFMWQWVRKKVIENRSRQPISWHILLQRKIPQLRICQQTIRQLMNIQLIRQHILFITKQEIQLLTNLRRNENVFQQKVFSLFACLLDSLTTWLPFALRARTEIGKFIKPTLGNWTRLLLGLFYSTIDWLTDTKDFSTLVHSWPDLVFSSVGEDWLPTVSWEDSIS